MTRPWSFVAILLLVIGVAGCGKESEQPQAPSQPAPADTRAAPATSAPASADTKSGPDVRALSLTSRPWKGDFEQMLERNLIRVLVPPSRTLYFVDKGTERGLTAETVRDFERYINKKYNRDKRPVTVMIIPTTRDKLIGGVESGLGDIAAGNITVTDARLKVVDFYAPDDQKLHAEWVVTGPGAPVLASLDDLSGKTVSVRKSTSYYESLAALNQRFAAEKKAPVDIQLLPDALADEDILEMLNVGMLQITVVDDWEASVWEKILPNIRSHPDLALRTGAKIGWAIRKQSPQLAAAIEDFRENYLVKQGVSAYRIAQYMQRFKQLHNPAKGEDEKRFEAAKALFYEYGPEYGFDPVMLAAQGYQESRLDQEAKSHVGAKYMDRLMTQYFKDAKFDEQNRSLFAFASYNAGPGRIAQMRKEAEKRGLDPNVWFNNVEIVTAEKVGMETTTYVRNIYKYYVAYKLVMEANAAKELAKRQVAPGKS